MTIDFSKSDEMLSNSLELIDKESDMIENRIESAIGQMTQFQLMIECK
jgi:hypothetical protein